MSNPCILNPNEIPIALEGRSTIVNTEKQMGNWMLLYSFVNPTLTTVQIINKLKTSVLG